MQLNKIVCFFLLLVSTNIFSQNSDSQDITSITRATFLSPGISYEARVGKFQSIVGNAYLSTSFYLSYSSTFGTNSGIYFDPGLSLQYRYYYNYAKREANGKRTAKNSLNYISGIAESVFTTNRLSSSYLEEEDSRPIYSVGIAWGFQRNYPKRFSLDLNLGVGYAYASNTKLDQFGQLYKVNAGRFTMIADLSLGFWLNKRD